MNSAKTIKKDDTIIMRKLLKQQIENEHHDLFEHVSKYSNSNEFRDIDLRFAL